MSRIIGTAPRSLSLDARWPGDAVGSLRDRRPVFLVSERTQFGNLGDIVLNRVLLEILAEQGPIITVRATEPPLPLAAALDRLAHRRLTPRAAIWQVASAILAGRRIVVCLNPGGYGGGLTVHTLLSTAGYALARFVGVRLVRIGFSLGPVTPARRRLERWLRSLFAVCAVRDCESRAELSGGRRAPPALLPDLALLSRDLGPPPDPAAPRSRLLVSLRGGTAARHELHQRLAPLLRALAAEHGLELAFVAQVAGDAGKLRELAAATAAEFHLLDSNDPAVFERTNALYGSAAVLVTNRLHAGIFAAMNGCVPVALIDPRRDRKIVGVMQDARCADLIHDETAEDGLAPGLRSILAERGARALRLDRAIRVASIRGRRSAHHLFRTLVVGPTFRD